jgi:phospholipase/carboxylesterase|tara:strand:+ start:4690 stop:5361 length:672 start_codon:yes stop_codon:yes gene_type:complete
MSVLKYGRKASFSGNCDSLVILIHGYGADGTDLLGLANSLGQHMPNTVFVAPDAPHKCQMNPSGREWFPIPWIDGSSEVDARLVMEQAINTTNIFIDDMIKAENVDINNTILLGFSQGTMLSLHLAPRRDTALAGVVGFSGRLLEPESLEEEVKSKMPILLVHGDSDDVVPFESLADAANNLTRNGFTVYSHVAKGVGHGISPDGLGTALQFMNNMLGFVESD